MNAFSKIFVCAGAALAISWVAPAPAEAQPVPPVRTVDVTGEAEVRVNPDQALVTLGVESWATDLATARKDNDTKTAKLLAVPPKYGVGVADFKTDFAQIEPQYQTDDRGQTRSIAGYRVTKIVTIRIADLSKVETLVTEALTAGANRLDSVTFGLADPAKVRAQVRLAAVRDAKAKAVSLVAELGQTVGRPITISEGPSGPGPGALYRVQAMNFEGSGGPTLAPGQVVVSAQVSVTFELKD